MYSNLDALLTAAKNGQLTQVKQLVEHQPTVNVKSNYGITPLVAASVGGHVTVVEWLVEQGAAINTPGEFNALHAASSQGHINVMKWLLQHQALINIKDAFNKTPLHYAAIEGHVEVVRLCLEEGSNINAQDDDHMTPLHWAAENGCKEVVNLLIEHGAYICLNECSKYALYRSGNDSFNSENESFYTTLLLAGVRTKENGIDRFDTIRDTNLQIRIKSIRAYIEGTIINWLRPLMLNHCQENLTSGVIFDVLQALPYLIQSIQAVKAQTTPTLLPNYDAETLNKFLFITDEKSDTTTKPLVNLILNRNINKGNSTRYAPIPVEIIARIREYLIDGIEVDKLMNNFQLKYPIAYYLWHDGMNHLKEYQLFYQALFKHDWQDLLMRSSTTLSSSF